LKSYYGSNGKEWPHGGTPTWLLDEIVEEFGPIFDPCPNNPTWDGLAIEWPRDRVVFCNPPYTRGQISKWVEKCHAEWVKGSTIVLLIPSYTDTRYFHNFIYHQAELRFIKGRLVFKGYEENKNKGYGASFPSMLCIFRGGLK